MLSVLLDKSVPRLNPASTARLLSNAFIVERKMRKNSTDVLGYPSVCLLSFSQNIDREQIKTIRIILTSLLEYCPDSFKD